jgi:predicted nuclease with TOPRIM domain
MFCSSKKVSGTSKYRMEKVYRLSFILVVDLCLAMTVISCKNKKTNTLELPQQDTVELKNKLENLKTKASQDSDFRKSKEYSAQMERTHIEIAKQKAKENSIENILKRYESSVHSLESLMNELKQNPKLQDNLSFMNEMKSKSEEVRNDYSILKKSTLTDEEKKRFDELSH